ncbi:MAG: hypothetical protein JXA73_16240 [Acidobacteria bacterium]|nr:hypothetical protein [Acidobacteriota bacterium]
MSNSDVNPQGAGLVWGFALAFVIGLLILLFSSASNAPNGYTWNGANSATTQRAR